MALPKKGDKGITWWTQCVSGPHKLPLWVVSIRCLWLSSERVDFHNIPLHPMYDISPHALYLRPCRIAAQFSCFPNLWARGKKYFCTAVYRDYCRTTTLSSVHSLRFGPKRSTFANTFSPQYHMRRQRKRPEPRPRDCAVSHQQNQTMVWSLPMITTLTWQRVK